MNEIRKTSQGETISITQIWLLGLPTANSTVAYRHTCHTGILAIPPYLPYRHTCQLSRISPLTFLDFSCQNVGLEL